MSDKATLIEFGFTELRAEKALRATSNSGLQQALDWLEAHSNDADIDDPISESSASSSAPLSAATGSAAESLQCTDCGKQFATPELAQYHATKSGHANFAESTEAVKPLSEAEKQEKLQEVQRKIAAKRAQREEEARAEQKQGELIRRKAGQDMTEAVERMKEEEVRRALAKQKREKEDDKRAEARIKQMILQDKKDRAMRVAKEKAERDGTSAHEEAGKGPAGAGAGAAAAAVSLLDAGVPTVSVAKGSSARLQIRPMLQSDKDVRPLTKTFAAEQTLGEVVDAVRKEMEGVPKHFKLSMAFPRKDFSSHDEKKTLRELGLAPSAALILTE
ncbi:hypothetical protein LPJ66_009548 [Kickxella alabastrina]|uniref:Uncharacterized protein n=1 Tax=Kickxella alabastrina TaxID=61397 RepID=A0ACC1I6T4_9FUNG|nr:hypothetical protein LPJ66_009548 [Kickxella alabastrina]